ncbi:hypothetical protein BT96DRAFT_1000928 [Gymnopus androsaceus JB14]|uniref:CxC2-like cysteine cluster KDZ transposase-associated domain-containing protein n=1 Tax=Gymnopus androsaceus JB14 TaxID=1447944 RepID=A0A6A4H2F8_9AGAR|nr:hypothetical protein BT96DRAFT_1000928 [Gymnopus androsaceus JB14]
MSKRNATSNSDAKAKRAWTRDENPLAGLTLSTFVILAKSSQRSAVIVSQSLSADGRHIAEDEIQTMSSHQLARARPAVSSSASTEIETANIFSYDEPIKFHDEDALEQSDVVQMDRKSKEKSDYPLLSWMGQRNDALRVFMTVEGHSSAHGICTHCKDSEVQRLAEYTCKDCFSQKLVCATCCVRNHSEKPLDTIKKWNGKFFEDSSLQELGLHLQLGHPNSTSCPYPEPGPDRFTLIDIEQAPPSQD